MRIKLHDLKNTTTTMRTAKIGRNISCPCGSGKKFKHCCGTSTATPSPTKDGVTQAMALLQQGKLLQAEQLLSDLVKEQPLNPNYHYLKGYVALQSGRHLEAAVAMDRAIELGLADAAGFYHYGCTLAALGRYLEAADEFERSLSLKPDFLTARTHLANCFFELRDFVQAEQYYKQVLLTDPGNLVACHNLGQVFYLSKRSSEAITYFERAANAAPNVAELWGSLATMQETENRLEAAEVSAKKALLIDPTNVTAAVAIARVLRRRNQAQEALETLDAAEPSKGTADTAIAYWSERGQNLEVLGHYREAFEAYCQSKSLLATTHFEHYDALTIEKTLAHERVMLSSGRVNQLALKPSPCEPVPLFIVGFPRSGTTLLEQMLGCHTMIAPCGELTSALEREGGKPGYIDQLGKLIDQDRQNKLAALREEYLAVLKQHRMEKTAAHYASDKMPLNLMRLGLIRLLFPEARIIHVVRHPLDAVLSAYFTPFLLGNAWSLRLIDTAHLFVETWRHAETMRQLPGLHYQRVRYEDLVSNPEPVLKQVLASLDLPWEPQCLSFHESQRVAHTASYAQVTRALYQTSKNRYRHYLNYMDAATLALLAPTITEAGYQVEYS